MRDRDANALRFCDADAALRRRLVAKLNVPGRHRLSETTIHLDDGFTIVALRGDEPVGVISIRWSALPAPLAGAKEAFIDLIDVDPEFRRQGVARTLVGMALQRARAAGAYQIRAWTSEEPAREAALRLWRASGFGICPAEVLAGPQAVRVRGCFVVRRLEG